MRAASSWHRSRVTDVNERSPAIHDSRRLFGPNQFALHAGAVLEVTCVDARGRDTVGHWAQQVARFAAALGWFDATVHTHVSRESAMLFITAPIDGLMTATEVTELAWVAAEAAVDGQPTPDVIAMLREGYTRERQSMPHLVGIQAYARQRGLVFSLDGDACSVGSGTGVRTVTHGDVPVDDVSEFDEAWESAHDVPIALVTGSNGKTTTTRLVAAMWRASGRCTGWNCSDGVWVDHDQLEDGDYTGPTGARRVIGDVRVQAAVLETARGGMLRRGLAVNWADGAIITNISADHFGEYGIETLADLAQAKRLVARALRPGAPLVLNADDETLRALAHQLTVPIVWFSAQDHPLARLTDDSSPAAPAMASIVRDGALLLHRDGAWHHLGLVQDMPLTLQGAAVHNIANLAGAALLASVVGVPLDAIRAVVTTFGAATTDNPGRLMVRACGGLTVVMDYAHNPDGLASLSRTAASLRGSRRLLLLGQAGDRDDAQLAALATTAWQSQSFDRVIIKELPSMRRGRAPGVVSAVLRAALLAAGAPDAAIAMADDECEGVRAALAWGRAGDVLVLGVHAERARVLALIDALVATEWTAGDPVPAC